MGAGLEAFIYREIENLYSRGFEIRLFATKFKQGDVYSPKPEWPYHILTAGRLLLLAPILVFRMFLRPRLVAEAIRDKGLLDLVWAARFAPIMRKTGVQQIHCHFGDHKFFIGYYCKRLTGLPLSVTIHAHEFYTNPNERLFRKALNEADRIFPIAKRWYEKLKADYGVPPDRLVLSRLFVDIDAYRPASPIRVIAVGRFTERKGFEYLLQAALDLADLDMHFMFVGFGEVDIGKRAEELGLQARVTVFDKMNQEQLRTLYQMSDILCVPSITTEREGAEGIPVVLMEGMACGLPVVASNCGAIEEIVEEYLVAERAPMAIATALRRLASNEGLRRAHGARNRELVTARFSVRNLDAFASSLVELTAHVGGS
jgi:glycosyltransferase involved in cell wall biosynthesis